MNPVVKRASMSVLVLSFAPPSRLTGIQAAGGPSPLPPANDHEPPDPSSALLSLSFSLSLSF